MSVRWLDSLYKPVIDPRRVDRTFRRFDQDLGFARYHALCRDRFQRPVTPPGALLSDGFEYLPVLEQDYLILTPAITRPDLHASLLPAQLGMLGDARARWIVNVDNVGNGPGAAATAAQIETLLGHAPNVDLDVLRPTGRAASTGRPAGWPSRPATGCPNAASAWSGWRTTGCRPPPATQPAC